MIKLNEDHYVLCRQLEVHHAVQMLQDVNWSAIFAPKHDVNEMASAFMTIIEQAVPFVCQKITMSKNKRTRLPKNINKLTHNKCHC